MLLLPLLNMYYLEPLIGIVTYIYKSVMIYLIITLKSLPQKKKIFEENHLATGPEVIKKKVYE